MGKRLWRSLLFTSLLVAHTGCYFEGTTAFHPRINQGAGDSGPGWSLGINIGFYLDASIPVGRLRAIGLGLSPTGFNGYGIKPFDPGSSAAAKALALRADAAFAFSPISGSLHHSLTFAYDFLSSISVTGPAAGAESGDKWFVGTGLDYRMPVANGLKKGTILFRLSAGVERFNVESITSTGIGARLMILPAFIGSYRPGPYENYKTSGSSSKSPVCYWSKDCDAYGNCKSEYKCP